MPVSSLNQYLPISGLALGLPSQQPQLKNICGNSGISVATQSRPPQLREHPPQLRDICRNSGTSTATLTSILKSTLLQVLVGLDPITIVGPSNYILGLGTFLFILHSQQPNWILHHPALGLSVPPDHNQTSQAIHPPTETTWDILCANLSAVSTYRVFPRLK